VEEEWPKEGLVVRQVVILSLGNPKFFDVGPDKRKKHTICLPIFQARSRVVV